MTTLYISEKHVYKNHFSNILKVQNEDDIKLLFFVTK